MAQGIKQLNKEALYWLEKTDPETYEAEMEERKREKRSARKRAEDKARSKARRRNEENE